MTANNNLNTPRTGRPPVRISAKAQRPKLRNLPGLIAISLYMLLLAADLTLNVVNKRFPAIFLCCSALFIASGFGLMLLLRWAWALALAAMAMLAGLFLRDFFLNHTYSTLAYGLLNLVIFLYLVRPDIREKLK